MAAANIDFYRLGGLIIPAQYRPEFCTGVLHPQSDGSTNLFGGAVGARGGSTCTLWWEVCPPDVFAWWFSGEAMSAIIPRDSLWGSVDEVVLPDDSGIGDPVQNYPYHGRYDYAVVHKIEKIGQPRRFWGYNKQGGKPYSIGTVQVRITHIGDVPPL